MRIDAEINRLFKILVQEGVQAGSDKMNVRLGELTKTLGDQYSGAEKNIIEEQVVNWLHKENRPPSSPPNRQRQRGQQGGAQRVCNGIADLLKAPYRFVEINDRIAWAEGAEIVDINDPIKDGVSASIDVTWAAETPLLIGEGQGMRNGVEQVGPLFMDGRWVVPGASLKGMLRASLEIIAFARVNPVDRELKYGPKGGRKVSVGEVLNRVPAQKKKPKFYHVDNKVAPKRVDMVENLFGFVLEEGEFDFSGDNPPSAAARKGRVAFSFGTFEDGPERSDKIDKTEGVDTVMMGARASFAPFYLRGKHKDWSDPQAKLSGRKRYIPHYPDKDLTEDILQGKLAAQIPNGDAGENPDIKTNLVFLKPKEGKPDMRFTSKIRLHNVSHAELGAVLWALTFGGDTTDTYRHMLGRAKAFGAGQVRVAAANLATTPNFGGERQENVSHRPFLDAFETLMEGKVPGWKTSIPLKEYLGCCDQNQGKELDSNGKLDYMPKLANFKTVRDAAKLDHNGTTPCFHDKWDGRYLETPKKKP